MTLEEFVSVFNGGARLTIDGYCNEQQYDYYLLPSVEDEDFSGNNRNHCIPDCLAREPWWDEVKDREVAEFAISREERFAELYIRLE